MITSCHISKSVNFGKYMKVVTRYGQDPRELYNMSRVRVTGNKLLNAIVENITQLDPGIIVLVDGKWYQFQLVSVFGNSFRLAQMLTNSPHSRVKQIHSIRYVDIHLA